MANETSMTLGDLVANTGNLIPSMAPDILQRSAEKRSTARDMLSSIGESKPLNRGQQIGMLLTTILPIIAGAALAKKKGAYAGLAAGSEGGVSAIKSLDDRQQRSEAADVRRSTLLEREADTLESQAHKLLQEERDFEKSVRLKEEGRDMQVEVMNRTQGLREKIARMGQDVSLEKDVIKDVRKRHTDLNDMISKAADVLGFIQAKIKDGTFDPNEDFFDALRRNFKSNLMDPNGEAAKLMRMLKKVAVSEGKKFFPGAISDAERDFMLNLTAANDWRVSINTLREVLAGTIYRSENEAMVSQNYLDEAGISTRFVPTVSLNNVVGMPEVLPELREYVDGVADKDLGRSNTKSVQIGDIVFEVSDE